MCKKNYNYTLKKNNCLDTWILLVYSSDDIVYIRIMWFVCDKYDILI